MVPPSATRPSWDLHGGMSCSAPGELELIIKAIQRRQIIALFNQAPPGVGLVVTLRMRRRWDNRYSPLLSQS